ncbi:hypothetical protein HK100_005972 [Physocladia obscura]|uniref:Mic1 domain-containing protein n=1 Tax=Physocladia obscura TaxID=109957 RepID=A0AAD5SS02_9FUNG|nr:hypothetical protein HK100_005972 [Physocladia obscura]
MSFTSDQHEDTQFMFPSFIVSSARISSILLLKNSLTASNEFSEIITDSDSFSENSGNNIEESDGIDNPVSSENGTTATTTVVYEIRQNLKSAVQALQALSLPTLSIIKFLLRRSDRIVFSLVMQCARDTVAQYCDFSPLTTSENSNVDSAEEPSESVRQVFDLIYRVGHVKVSELNGDNEITAHNSDVSGGGDGQDVDATTDDRLDTATMATSIGATMSEQSDPNIGMKPVNSTRYFSASDTFDYVFEPLAKEYADDDRKKRRLAECVEMFLYLWLSRAEKLKTKEQVSSYMHPPPPGADSSNQIFGLEGPFVEVTAVRETTTIATADTADTATASIFTTNGSLLLPPLSISMQLIDDTQQMQILLASIYSSLGETEMIHQLTNAHVVVDCVQVANILIDGAAASVLQQKYDLKRTRDLNAGVAMLKRLERHEDVVMILEAAEYAISQKKLGSFPASKYLEPALQTRHKTLFFNMYKVIDAAGMVAHGNGADSDSEYEDGGISSARYWSVYREDWGEALEMSAV